MKLEHKHIIAYNLGENGVKIISSKSQGEFTTIITQIDFTESDLFYGNSYLNIDEGFEPYSLNGAKLILRDTEELTKEEAIELGWIDEEHLKRGIESGRISVNDMKYLINNEYDILDLISKDLAVNKKDDFNQAVRPLMSYLGKHCHPHMKAVVESNCAELVEGVQSVVTDEYIVD